MRAKLQLLEAADDTKAKTQVLLTLHHSKSALKIVKRPIGQQICNKQQSCTDVFPAEHDCVDTLPSRNMADRRWGRQSIDTKKDLTNSGAVQDEHGSKHDSPLRLFTPRDEALIPSKMQWKVDAVQCEHGSKHDSPL